MIKPFLYESQMNHVHAHNILPSFIGYNIDDSILCSIFSDIIKDVCGRELSVSFSRNDDDGISVYTYIDTELETDEESEEVQALLEEKGIPWEDSYEMTDWLVGRAFPGPTWANLEYVSYDSDMMYVTVSVPRQALR